MKKRIALLTTILLLSCSSGCQTTDDPTAPSVPLPTKGFDYVTEVA